jgi:large subunit ribosomal protein L32e
MAGTLRKLLNVRKKKKSGKPDFIRQEGYRHVKLKAKWRRPRGRHSKLRKGEKARGKKPSAGYSSPKSVKGLTTEGLTRVYVSNREELANVDPKTDLVVIRAGVGRKKRMEIAAEAERLKVKVQNAYRARLPGSG